MGWFSSRTDGMPDFGQGDGYKPSSFSTRKRVPVSKLVSTNRGGYLRPDKHKGSGTVYAVEKGGRYYIADGHHTAAAAIARGDKSVNVRVRKA